MRTKVKCRYKAVFHVWVQNKNGIVELDNKERELILPSIHEDYLKLQATKELQKFYFDKTVYSIELVRTKKYSRR